MEDCGCSRSHSKLVTETRLEWSFLPQLSALSTLNSTQGPGCHAAEVPSCHFHLAGSTGPEQEAPLTLASWASSGPCSQPFCFMLGHIQLIASPSLPGCCSCPLLVWEGAPTALAQTFPWQLQWDQMSAESTEPGSKMMAKTQMASWMVRAWTKKSCPWQEANSPQIKVPHALQRREAKAGGRGQALGNASSAATSW